MKDLKFVNDENDLLDAMLLISSTNKGPVKQFPSLVAVSNGIEINQITYLQFQNYLYQRNLVLNKNY